MTPADYENLVAEIAESIRSSTVDLCGLTIGVGKTNTIQGASGFKHQIDASLHDSQSIFIVECKRWKNKVDPSGILVLASRAIDIRNGNPDRTVKAILVSTQEVTEGVEKLAKYFDIEIEIVKSATEFGLRIGSYVQVGVQSKAEVGSSADADIVKRL